MIAVILAGGYARRLGPLGEGVAKPLLPIAGKPIVEYIIEKVNELNAVRRIIISTNLKFRRQFERWLATKGYGNVEIVVEGSRSEEEKLGAVKALAEVTRNVDDGVLIIAGDNYFSSSLKGMLSAFLKRGAPIVATYDVKDLKLAKMYACVRLDAEGRVVEMAEKPANPVGTLIATCIYMIPKGSLPMLRAYVSMGLGNDEPGRFMSWLAKRQLVYGYRLKGTWWDIGTTETYKRAKASVEEGTLRDVERR